jgi:tetratricopeptide (TPR) repeat protein
VGLAWVHNSRHEFDEGTRWAKRAIAADPTLHEAHALLGDAAVELGEYDAAYEHYQAALDLSPSLSSYSRAAHLLWITGDALRARHLLQKAIDAGGPYAENTAWCRAQLARMLFHGGALLLAERQADAALRLAPDNYHVLATMGEIKAAKQESAEAIDYYRRAVAVTVTPNPDALVALGDLYAISGQRDAAEECYARVVSILSSGGTGHDHGASHGHAHSHGSARLARFYADHDRNLDDALREAELAHREFPNVFVADTLAWCFYKNGRYDEARQTIHAALKWKTPDANILFHAGMIYARLGDRPAAQSYLYRALSLNPRFHIQNAEVAAQTLAALSVRPEKTQPAAAVSERAGVRNRPR